MSSAPNRRRCYTDARGGRRSVSFPLLYFLHLSSLRESLQILHLSPSRAERGTGWGKISPRYHLLYSPLGHPTVSRTGMCEGSWQCHSPHDLLEQTGLELRVPIYRPPIPAPSTDKRCSDWQPSNQLGDQCMGALPHLAQSMWWHYPARWIAPFPTSLFTSPRCCHGD